MTKDGFTVLELLVVVALVSILVGVAGVAAPRLLAPLRLRNAVAEIVSDLQLLRVKAISLNRDCRAVFTSGGETFETECIDDSGVWKPHALYGRTKEAAASSPIDLPASITTSAGTVTFTARGDATAAASVTLFFPSGATHTVTVTLGGGILGS